MPSKRTCAAQRRHAGVIHDDNLKRLTGESGKVSDIPYRELSKMRLLGTDEKVMTLDECLAYIGGRTPLLLEVKDVTIFKSFPEQVVRVMKQYAGEYALQSFNPFYVHAFKQMAPEILRGQLAMSVFSPDVLVSCRDTLEEFDISPEIFACEGGLSRRQVKGGCGVGGAAVGLYGYAQALEDRRLGDQDDDHELYHQARFRQLLLLQSSLSPRQEKGKPRGAYVDDPFASGSGTAAPLGG